MIHAVYVFDRAGVCLYYRAWRRPHAPLSAAEDRKLMFGLLFSLKSFAAKMDPAAPPSVLLPPPLPPLRLQPNAGEGGPSPPAPLGRGCSFRAFRTNTYKLSFLESPSGIKIVLISEPRMGDMREPLKHIYSRIYAECIVKNPLHTPGQPFSCELFATTLDQYVKTLQ
eukprot:SM000099S25208  [mRNA]  locus=s99:271621:272722:+ [translate_table: standard]